MMESIIYCPQCGSENKGTHEFCGSCGLKLEQKSQADSPFVDQSDVYSPPTPITPPSETQSNAFSGYQTSASQPQRHAPYQAATVYRRPVDPRLTRKATTSLVLGILSLVASFILWFLIVSVYMIPLLVLPIVGIVLAVQANKHGTIGFAIAGLVMSILGLLGQLGAFIILLIFFL